jgi:hypothetical protein
MGVPPSHLLPGLMPKTCSPGMVGSCSFPPCRRGNRYRIALLADPGTTHPGWLWDWTADHLFGKCAPCPGSLHLEGSGGSMSVALVLWPWRFPFLRPFEPFLPRPSDLSLPWGLDSGRGPGLISENELLPSKFSPWRVNAVRTLKPLSTHLHISATVSLRVAHLTLRYLPDKPNV